VRGYRYSKELAQAGNDLAGTLIADPWIAISLARHHRHQVAPAVLLLPHGEEKEFVPTVAQAK
jgi:hypothetical protein